MAGAHERALLIGREATVTYTAGIDDDVDLLARVLLWPLATASDVLRMRSDRSQNARQTSHGGGLRWRLVDRREEWTSDGFGRSALRRVGQAHEQEQLAVQHVWANGGGSPIIREMFAPAIARVGSSLVRVVGGDIRALTGVDDDMNAIKKFRAATSHLPWSLLVAGAQAAKREGEAQAVAESDLGVRLGTRRLQRYLTEGSPFAVTHLHLGAARDFDSLWLAALRHVESSKGVLAVLQLPDSADLVNREQLANMLVRASIARVLLAGVAWHGWTISATGCDEFERRLLGERAKRHAQNVFADLAANSDDFCRPRSNEHDETRRVPSSSRNKNGESYWPHHISLLRLFYAEGRRHRGSARGSQLERLLGLNRWRDRKERTDELDLACHYLVRASRNELTPELGALWWQYLRTRLVFYRYVVQPPNTPGLGCFSARYGRITPLIGSRSAERWCAALRREGRYINLGSLEARRGPEPGYYWIVREIEAMARGVDVYTTDPDYRLQARRSISEVGMVVHFIKGTRRRSSGARRIDGRPPSAYRAWYDDRETEASDICACLRHLPEVLMWLRGVDVASKEREIPGWVVKPLFELLRSQSERAAARLNRWAGSVAVEPLRVTVHAGEDFARLITGIRAVHEAAEHLLRAGERIGHAIALAVPVDEWCARNRSVRQSTGERLDDLVWESALLHHGVLNGLDDRARIVEGELNRLAREVFRPSGCTAEDNASPHSDIPTSSDLRAAREILFSHGFLRSVGWGRPGIVQPAVLNGDLATTTARRWANDHVVAARLAAPLTEPVEVTASETSALRALQAYVRRVLAAREITVESNPSSNRIVGHATVLPRSVASTLIGGDGDDADERSRGNVQVRASINSDDPVVFATSISHECAYLYDAMRSEGLGTEAIFDRLERARSAGWESRFTLPNSGHLLVELSRRLHRTSSPMREIREVVRGYLRPHVGARSDLAAAESE